MGSLHLLPKGIVNEGRIFGEQISDFQFANVDGIEVFVSLNVDINGYLFELYSWKTDYGKLLKFLDL